MIREFFRVLGAHLAQTSRYLWLNVYALLALAAGLVFAAWVPQAREIFANLVAASVLLSGAEGARNFHTGFYGVAAAIWGGAIWYSMRVLSSTRFPGDPQPNPLAASWAKWMRAELPRLAAFFGLASLALCTSVFLEGAPTLRWLPVLSVGLVPLAWAFTHAADRTFARRTGAGAGLPHYPYSVLVVTLAATALAISAWWSFPHAWKSAGLIDSARNLQASPDFDLAPGLSGWLLILSVAASLAGLALGRRAAARAAMLASLFAWAAAAGTAALEAHFFLPMAVLAFAIFGLWWTSRRRRLHGIQEGDAANEVVEIGRATRRVLTGTIVALALLIAGFSWFPIFLGNLLGTLAIAFLALALWCFFGTVIWVFLPKRLGWASLALVPILWALVLGRSADHGLRGVEFAAPGAHAERPGLAQHFDDWRGRLPEGEASPIFFVAAAGGGLRAGFWTANLLAAMDDATCGEFGRHVYAYSGVSGGSLGISAYLAQRKIWDAKKNPEERCQPGRSAEITRFLGRDFLAPVAGSLAFAEAFQELFVPFTYLKNERGSALSGAWSEAWDEVFGDRARGRFNEPFLNVFNASPPKDLKAAAMPAVFINATGVNSGRRVIAANVIAPIPGVDDLFYASGTDRDTKLKTHRLPLREAVLNSARFTYVSPAGTVIGCFPRRDSPECDPSEIKVWDRLVDGGYFENSGLSTLTDVMRLLDADAPAASRPFANPVFLVIIDNSAEPVLACSSPPPRLDLRAGMTEQMEAAEAARKRKLRTDVRISRPSGEVSRMSESTAPIEAFLNVREERASLEVRRVSAQFDCPYVLDWSLFGSRREARQARRAMQQPALGWFLSTRSAEWMIERAKRHADELPFDLAACDDGKKPTRGRLGSPDLHVKCPAAKH